MDYTEEMIETAWRKARKVADINPDAYRKDEFGAWISRRRFNVCDRPLSFGWVVVMGGGAGSEGEDGFRPLQWQNAMAVQRQKYSGRVTADGFYNRYVRESNSNVINENLNNGNDESIQ